MSIQTLQTAGTSKGSERKGRQLVGLVGSLALAAVVTAGVVIGVSNQQAGSSGSAAVTSSPAVQRSVPSADTFGGVAERTQMQAQVSVAAVEPEHPLNATDIPSTGQLAAPAQANVMGGVAERMTIQQQLAATP